MFRIDTDGKKYVPPEKKADHVDDEDDAHLPPAVLDDDSGELVLDDE